MGKELLNIEDLYVNAGDKEILKGINLRINKGEIHVIMGPNGSGKSTTANAIFNNPEYIKTNGKIELEGKNIFLTNIIIVHKKMYNYKNSGKRCSNANNRCTFKKSKFREQNESCCFCNIR